jgi:hypothetical protein
VFAAEARQRVALLDAEENAQDDAAWLRAERRNSKAAYAGYLTTYPNGRRAREARVRIAELERSESRPPADPAKAPPGRRRPPDPPDPPEPFVGPRWPAADEPFVGADGRIRR